MPYHAVEDTLDKQETREELVKAFVRQTKCALVEAEKFDDAVKSILRIEDDEPPEYLADALMFTDLFDHLE